MNIELFFYNKKYFVWYFVHMWHACKFIQGTKAHNGYNGCPRCIEKGQFIDNEITFSDHNCAGNNSTVTEEPIVLLDLPIMSDELFIAFDKDCLNIHFLKQMVNISCEYVSILKFKLFLFRLPNWKQLWDSGNWFASNVFSSKMLVITSLNVTHWKIRVKEQRWYAI
jgi:hypothetical protein